MMIERLQRKKDTLPVKCAVTRTEETNTLATLGVL